MITWLIVGFFVLLALAVPVGHVLVISSGAAILAAREFPVALVAQQMVNQTLSFPMLALPFFILSGSLMMSGRLGEKLIGFATELVQRFRGGLGSVTVLGSCVFGGVSGSAVADATALGGMLIPWQVREGYPAGFAAANNSAAATISILIPPSIPFILYSLVSNVSIADLFLAGVLPGLMLTGGFVAVCNASARLRGFPMTDTPFDAAKCRKLFVDALPALVMRNWAPGSSR
jgi:tripartite ATP-independent transporter DctM subunit